MSESDTSQPVCQEGDRYLPNPQDPHTFYECKEGVPYLHHCPIGLIFNPDAEPGPVCDYPSNVTKYWADDVDVS
jgi:hypothetical protein